MIRRCIAGEESAWQGMILRYSPLLKGAVVYTMRTYGILPQPMDVEERVWEVWESLSADDAKYLREFRWDSPLDRWLARVGRNAVLRWIRRESVRKTVPLDDSAAGGEGSGPVRSASDPARIAETSDTAERIRVALARLPEKDRDLLEARYLREENYRRIASRWNAPVSTVAHWISQAKDRLISLLDDLRLPLL